MIMIMIMIMIIININSACAHRGCGWSERVPIWNACRAVSEPLLVKEPLLRT